VNQRDDSLVENYRFKPRAEKNEARFVTKNNKTTTKNWTVKRQNLIFEIKVCLYEDHWIIGEQQQQQSVEPKKKVSDANFKLRAAQTVNS
jgi:predicted HicB family RNase H-like nuclease